MNRILAAGIFAMLSSLALGLVPIGLVLMLAGMPLLGAGFLTVCIGLMVVSVAASNIPDRSRRRRAKDRFQADVSAYMRKHRKGTPRIGPVTAFVGRSPTHRLLSMGIVLAVIGVGISITGYVMADPKSYAEFTAKAFG